MFVVYPGCCLYDLCSFAVCGERGSVGERKRRVRLGFSISTTATSQDHFVILPCGPRWVEEECLAHLLGAEVVRSIQSLSCSAAQRTTSLPPALPSTRSPPSPAIHAFHPSKQLPVRSPRML